MITTSAIETMPITRDILKSAVDRIEKATGVKVELNIRLAYMKKPEDKKIQLQQLIVKEFNYPWYKIISQSRKEKLSDARQTYMYFCKHHLNQTLTITGSDLGFRNHSTIKHGIHTVEMLLSVKDEFITEKVERIARQLKETNETN